MLLIKSQYCHMLWKGVANKRTHTSEAQCTTQNVELDIPRPRPHSRSLVRSRSKSLVPRLMQAGLLLYEAAYLMPILFCLQELPQRRQRLGLEFLGPSIHSFRPKSLVSIETECIQEVAIIKRPRGGSWRVFCMYSQTRIPAH